MINEVKHISYSIKLNHIHDFEVEYQFLSSENGGRISGPPSQRYKSDFLYNHKLIKQNQVYMIYPEFLNDDLSLFENLNTPVSNKGTARMWITDPKMRPFHIKHIEKGLTCYLVEGTKKVAVCSVSKIVGLHSNPIT